MGFEVSVGHAAGLAEKHFRSVEGLGLRQGQGIGQAGRKGHNHGFRSAAGDPGFEGETPFVERERAAQDAVDKSHALAEPGVANHRAAIAADQGVGGGEAEGGDDRLGGVLHVGWLEVKARDGSTDENAFDRRFKPGANLVGLHVRESGAISVVVDALEMQGGGARDAATGIDR